MEDPSAFQVVRSPPAQLCGYFFLQALANVRVRLPTRQEKFPCAYCARGPKVRAGIVYGANDRIWIPTLLMHSGLGGVYPVLIPQRSYEQPPRYAF